MRKQLTLGDHYGDTYYPKGTVVEVMDLEDWIKIRNASLGELCARSTKAKLSAYNLGFLPVQMPDGALKFCEIDNLTDVVEEAEEPNPIADMVEAGTQFISAAKAAEVPFYKVVGRDHEDNPLYTLAIAFGRANAEDLDAVVEAMEEMWEEEEDHLG